MITEKQKHRFIVLLVGIVIIFFTISCKSDVENNSTLVYGLSLVNTFTGYENVYEPDSIVQIDLSKGIYKNLCATDKFEGLNSAYFKAYSKNQNMIVYYDPMKRKIGLIHLDNLTCETIDLNTDSTYKGIKSLAIIENKSLLVLFKAHYNYADKSHSIDIVEINLKTKIAISKSIDFDYTQYIFTAVDEINNRIFLVPNNNYSEHSDKLYIYNYQSNELTTKSINANFLDVHYSSANQCLVGSSYTKNGVGLLTYSINNQKTDTIGSYKEITGIRIGMNYFDKINNSYWIGILITQAPDYLKLTNISLSDVSYSKSIQMRKFIDIIN